MLPRWLRAYLSLPPTQRQHSRRTKAARSRLVLEPLEARLAPAAPFPEFIDPHPAAGNQFGATVLALSTGNVVITSPFDDAGGSNAGAVYLFNGATGALISTLTSSSPNDNIGSGGVTALTNGNFVISSPDWDNGGVPDAGAVTFGNGTTGLSGTVGAGNSLIGSAEADEVGIGGIIPLSTGNYVVVSPGWENGAAADAGAVTFGSGVTGVNGIITVSNSLIGSTASDQVGHDVSALANGNYVVISPNWDRDGVVDAGAVTFGSGTVGASGVVTIANSLLGAVANDRIGSGGVAELTNSNYVVVSPNWDDEGIADVGAVTWAGGTTGLSGEVNAANSLIGSTENDNIGSGTVTALTNGNYVVISPLWDDGGVANAGAATWASGTAGITGAVSAANSLVGSTASDQVGNAGVTALTNGNYVVASANWDDGGVGNVGAATWGNGTTGITGPVSAANSLIGSTADDAVGSGGATALTNGNYVVRSTNWDDGAMANVGAVTWGNGATGIVGTVSAANSLVGTTENDAIGHPGVTALTNGNYVVRSNNWDNGGISNAGAVTFGNGTTGIVGAVSAANSLVGTTASDIVGSASVTALPNGNYVVASPFWNNDAVVDAGAVTLGDGTVGTTGPVSAANSLVGSTASDQVGGSGVTALSNSNYVVRNPFWDSGFAANVGAVVLGNGSLATVGPLTTANSLIGGSENDAVGSGAVFALANGNYVITSPSWDNGPLANAGAVTFGNGTAGIVGIVSPTNSIVGAAANTNLQPVVADDVNNTYFARFLTEAGGKVRLGSQQNGIAVPFNEFIDPNPAPGNQFGFRVLPLATGNVVITSPGDDAGGTDAGAVYLFNGATGALISTLLGFSAGDQIGNAGVVALTNGNYVVGSSEWQNGAALDAGAATFGNGITGVNGTVSAANSLVGSSVSDSVGGVIALTNGNYVVRSFRWDNGGFRDAGAVTFGNGTTGTVGVVSAANSLVGTNTNDRIGSGGVTPLSTGNYVVNSLGAVTFANGTTGITGTINETNSLVGIAGGSSVVPLTNGNYVVVSPFWEIGNAISAGAVTFGNGTTGIVGTVSAANSLVGSKTRDLVGWHGELDGVTALSNGNYVVYSQFWDNGSIVNVGAVTFGSGTTGISGIITSTNSLIGSQTSDLVGLGGVVALSNGNYVVSSYQWDDGPVANVGAVTWADGTTGLTGTINAANSLVGSVPDDQVGITGVTALTNGNYVVRSPEWDNGAVVNAGAATFGNGTSGISGTVTTLNSLVGSSANDNIGSGGVVALTTGNFVVRSPKWDNGAITEAGAATLGNGVNGIAGPVSPTNSLIGSNINDQVSQWGVTPLNSGNYVVVSSSWDNGTLVDAGAASFGSGDTGIVGPVSAANSLVGNTAVDQVGSGGVTAFRTGNFAVGSNNWDNGPFANAGAVTFGDGTTGIFGTVSSTNSALGLTANTNLQPVIADNFNITYFARFLDEGGGRVRVGSQIDGFVPNPTSHFAVNVPTAVTAGTAFQVTVTALDVLNETVTGYTGTLHFTSSDPLAVLPPDTTLVNGTATFSVTFKTQGTHTITATDFASPSIAGTSNSTIVLGLAISTTTPTPSGFTATFTTPFDPSVINLYDAFGTFGVADVTLVHGAAPSLPIRGTLLMDPTNTSITFVKSGTGAAGVLQPGIYVVILRSAADGFKDLQGNLLDGNADGTPGDNFITTFTVGPTSSMVLSIPDFARGPDSASPIKLPNNTGTGIPVLLSAAAGVTDLTFDLNFNPALLNITATLNGPPGSTFELVSNSGGVASFHFTLGSASPLSANATLGQIVATVPDSATGSYKTKQLLHLSNIVSTGGSGGPPLANDAVQLVAYFGDANGDAAHSGADSSAIMRVSANFDTGPLGSGLIAGFAAYPLVDPPIIGDLNTGGTRTVDATDVTLINSYLTGTPRPHIPTIPTSISSLSSLGSGVRDEGSGVGEAESLIPNIVDQLFAKVGMAKTPIQNPPLELPIALPIQSSIWAPHSPVKALPVPWSVQLEIPQVKLEDSSLPRGIIVQRRLRSILGTFGADENDANNACEVAAGQGCALSVAPRCSKMIASE